MIMKKTITHYSLSHGLKLMAILFALLLFSGQSWGQSTIFSENMGTPSGTTSIVTYSTGTAPATFQNKGTYTYGNGGQTNPADLRATSVSSTYTGASGNGNVYFTATSGAYGFSIEGINASTYTNLSLQFGYRKEGAAAHAAFSVDYWDGAAWQTLANTSATLFNEAANAAAGWYLSKSLTLPVGAQISTLKIRFVKTTTVAIRVDDVILKGFPQTAPTVTTDATPSAISATAATLGGNVTVTGGASISANGFVYALTATNTNPAISGSGVTQLANPSPASGTGTFSLATSSALSINSQYSYRAYATNSVGTSYGGVSGTTFYTLANIPSAPTVNNPTPNSLDVIVNENSNPSTTEYAIHETSTGKYVQQLDGSLGASAVWQTAAAWGTKTVTGLTAFTSYTFEVKARNTANTETVFGASATLSTSAGSTPTLSVNAISSFGNQCINATYGPNSFTVTGENLTTANVTLAALDGYTYSLLSNDAFGTTLSIPQSGGSFSQLVYVQFSPTAVQSYNGDIVIGGGGAADVNRSVVGSGINTAASISSPTATAIDLTSVTLGGDITAIGCSNITERGIYWSTTNGFLDSEGTKVSETSGPYGTGTFTVDVSGLTQGTPYYYKAFATNAGGTVYTSQAAFTTASPSLSVGSITDFGSHCINTTAGPNSFTITGSYLTTADVTLAALDGYTYSLLSNDAFGTTLSIPQSGGSFSQLVYVQFSPTAVQSYNGDIVVGGGGSADINRSLVGSGVNTAATVTTTSPATSITAITVTLSGNVAAEGCQSVTARGICYGTSLNPDITGDFTTETGTTGAYSSNIINLTPNTTYHFRAYATTTAGTTYGSDVSFTTLNLSAPLATAASLQNSTAITAHWDAVDGASSYRLDVASTAGFVVNAISENFSGFTINAGSTDRGPSLDSYLQSTGWTGTRIYEMPGYTKLGSTSGQGIITTPTINISANSGNATLTFDLGKYGSDAGLVQVYHAADGTNFSQLGSDITPPATLTRQTLSITGGTVNSKIKIQAKNASNNRFYLDSIVVQYSTTLSSYNDLSVSGTSHEVTGLNSNTNYYYRLRAYSASSTSANSNVIIALTAPAAPLAKPATSITATAFVANWFASVGATGYKLEVATDDLFSTIVAGYNGLDVSNVTNYSVSGLDANTTYYYRVAAYNTESSLSPYSSYITVLTAPETPTAIEPTNIAANGFTANWNAVAGADGYGLYVSTDINFGSFITGYNDLDVLNVTNYNISGLSPNTTYYYRVYAYNSNLDVTENSNTITVLTTPTAATASITHPSCTVGTGTIEITAPLGADYEYSLDLGTYQSSTTFANVSSGGHTIYVRSASVPSSVSEVTVVMLNDQPFTPSIPMVSETQPNCTTLGSIEVTSPFGTGMTYSIGLAYQSEVTFASLAGGTYTVTAKNTDGCISQGFEVILQNQPSTPIQATVEVTQPTCTEMLGTITVTAPIGSDLSYSIDDMDYSNVGGIFTSVSANSYNVTVKNTSGCVSVAKIAIVNNQPATPLQPLVSITQPSCTVNTATLTVTSDVTDLFFSIDGIDYTNTTGEFTGIAASSTYSVTARNADGCVSPAATGTIAAAKVVPLAPQVVLNQPDCFINSGTITASVNLPSPSPSPMLSPPIYKKNADIFYSIDGVNYTNTTGIFSAVSPGNYSVTIKNESYCISPATDVTINPLLDVPTTPVFDVTQPSCTEATATITVTSSTTGLEFSIDGIDYSNTTGIFTGIVAGASYSITARNADGCISLAITGMIDDQPLPPTVSIQNPSGLTTLTCTNPSIDVTATGGGTYSWSNGTTVVGTLADLSITSPATFTVTVTGSNGCSATEQIIIDQDISIPIAGILNPSGLTTLTCTTTSIDVTATGTGTYSWSDGATEVGTSATLSISSPATYIVTVTGNNGCTATEQIIIDQDISTPIAGILNPSGLTTLTCTTTSIDISATGGGSYSWSNGTIVVGTSASLSISSPATYTVTITGNNGCTATDQITIDQDIATPTASILNPSGLTTLTCATPSIDVTATAGVDYSWSNGSTVIGVLEDLSITSAATYTVTVTSANGCTATDEIIVDQDFTIPIASITNNTGLTILDCNTTVIDVTANGGGSYSWSGGSSVSSDINSFTSADTYTVTVTADNGCTSTESIVIGQDIAPPSIGITNLSATTILNCINTSVVVTATGGLSYSWSDGTLTADNIFYSPDTYTVTVTGDNGCTATDFIIISEDILPPPQPDVIVTQPSCSVHTATVSVISDTTGLHFSKDGLNYTSTNGVFSGLAANSPYNITARSSNGCVSSAASGFINAYPVTPSAPSGFTTTVITASSFIANWSPVTTFSPGSGVIGYKIDVSTSSLFTSFVPGYNDLTVSPANSKLVNGLLSNTTYYYKVRAYNSSCTSVSSIVIPVTTLGIPTVSTTAISSIAATTATSGGHISYDGGSSVNARGVCWNTSGGPSLADDFTTDASGSGTFVSYLINLNPGTPYFVKAYATNNIGTAYGNQVVFSTASGNDMIVSNTNDSGPGSLREAMDYISDNGIIRFAPALNGQTITLMSGTLYVYRNFFIDNSNLPLGITIAGLGDNISIYSGNTLTLASGSKITVVGNINFVYYMPSKPGSGLVLASGVSFIHNTNNLAATVQRELNANWHLFGSPFKKNSGAALGNIIPPGGSTQMKPYTNGSNWGSNITSAIYPFVPTVGYAIKPNMLSTASLSGNLYFSPVVFDYTNALVYNGTSAAQSWNLMANPYTSYLNWNLLGKTNVSSTLYLWDNALYPNLIPVASASYMRTFNSCNNVGVPAGTTPYIAPLQGFFVKAVYTNPKLTFPPSARTHASGPYYKDASNTTILVRLKAETEAGVDELVICKNQDAKSDFEQFDSEKMFSELPLQIYSQSSTGEQLIINTINTTDNNSIPLGIIGNTGAKARITAFALETTEQLYLEDRLKGKMISLSENTTYDFEFPTDVITGRFFIRFGNMNAPLTTSDVKVFANDNMLNIVAQTGEEIDEVEVYTVTGSRVFKSDATANMLTVKLDLTAGVYLVRVKTNLGTQNVKLSWK